MNVAVGMQSSQRVSPFLTGDKTAGRDGNGGMEMEGWDWDRRNGMGTEEWDCDGGDGMETERWNSDTHTIRRMDS